MRKITARENALNALLDKCAGTRSTLEASSSFDYVMLAMVIGTGAKVRRFNGSGKTWTAAAYSIMAQLEPEKFPPKEVSNR